MSDNRPDALIPSKGGVFQDLLFRFKLILRLMGDNRVSIFLKMIPFGTFVYLLFPDIFVGPVDDAAIIWLGTYLFVELCPPSVVEEHMAALNTGKDAARQQVKAKSPDEEIIDGQFRDQF